MPTAPAVPQETSHDVPRGLPTRAWHARAYDYALDELQAAGFKTYLGLCEDCWELMWRKGGAVWMVTVHNSAVDPLKEAGTKAALWLVARERADGHETDFAEDLSR